MRGSGETRWGGAALLILGLACGGPVPESALGVFQPSQEPYACAETKDCTVTYRATDGCCLTCEARPSLRALEAEAAIACAPHLSICPMPVCAHPRPWQAECREGVCVLRAGPR